MECTFERPAQNIIDKMCVTVHKPHGRNTPARKEMMRDWRRRICNKLGCGVKDIAEWGNKVSAMC